jgi:hypothetical protein
MIKTQTPYPGKDKQTIHAVETFTFKKEEGRWFIYLPEYLEQGWSKDDLEMVDGAYRLLQIIAHGHHMITLRLSTEHFEGADVLELVDHCEAPKGGAVYRLDTCRGKKVDASIWICDIALFVFGDMPEYIYYQRVRNEKYAV